MKKTILGNAGNVEIEVVENRMRKTDRGVEGSAKVRMGGKTIEMEGRWDDPYMVCDLPDADDKPAEIDERVKVDGIDQVCDGENSILFEVEDVDVETIANEIAE